MTQVRRALAGIVIGALTSLAGIAETPKPQNWVATGDLGVRPTRVTETLPLSDQANEGHWQRYEPMTDEFSGPALDPNKWWPQNPGWLGRQPALFYPGNVQVSDGKLHLTMRKEEAPEMPKDKGYHTYTSAAVQSKTRVCYGYFEIRARAMKSAGSSSFWFYDSTPTLWTEIDVFEIGGAAPGFERKYNMTLHVMKTPEDPNHWSVGTAWLAPFDLAADYHVYGLQWDKNRLNWYVDGVLVRWVQNTHWHQPLTLNFDSETMPEWFGLPRDSDLPSTYSIEYVRAWKSADTP
jgi:beta-glucanase (GH16 family)